MELPESTIAAVEEFKRKSVELSAEHNDCIITAVATGFADVIAMISKRYSIELIQYDLILLDLQKDNSLKLDKVKNDHLRNFLNDLREIIHLILNDCTDERNQVKKTEERSNQTDEIPNSAYSIPVESMEDPINQSDQRGLIENLGMEFVEDCTMFDEEDKMDENDFPNVTQPFESREELIDESQVFPVDDENSQIDEAPFDAEHNLVNSVEEEEEMGLEIDNAHDDKKETPDTVEEKKGKRPSRKVSNSVKNNKSMDDSDGDFAPDVKKPKSEKINKKRSSKLSDLHVKSMKKTSKINGSDLECPECDYVSRSAFGWTCHLYRMHHTTPILAGLALLCECGHEGASKNHINKCDIANFTIIRKRDGPIRRVTDEKATPKCVLCEMYPKTAYGYTCHLSEHHKTTLNEKQVYLKCSCGLEIRYKLNGRNYAKYAASHSTQCDPRRFTLHKLEEK